MMKRLADLSTLRRPALPRSLGGRALGLGIGLLVLPMLYWGLYPWLAVHTIDDDTSFRPPPLSAGASHAVAAATALIDREVNRHDWIANDPVFSPAYFYDNMANFQVGMVYAIRLFANEMRDQIGRVRGTSQVDADLDSAAGDLARPGDVWFIDPDVSLMPQASSEEVYRAAMRKLANYNQRLADGDPATVFERRADTLLTTLERFSADLGSASARTSDMLAEAGPWIFEGQSDDVFYANKGRLYAYYILLSGLGQDFETVIRDRQLETVWTKLLAGLRIAAELEPWTVLNASPDGLVFPNHLAAQGFYLMRARTQLKEVTNILLK